MDIADDLEGPPPYQASVADNFIIARNIDHLSSSGTTNMILYYDGSLHVKMNQHLGAREFILFPGEGFWFDDARDTSSSDTSSSRVLCSSEISMGSSTEPSVASTALASEEQQWPALDQLPQSDAEYCPGVKDMRHVVEWLQNTLPLSEEVARDMGEPCSKFIVAASPRAEKGQAFEHYRSPCHS